MGELELELAGADGPLERGVGLGGEEEDDDSEEDELEAVLEAPATATPDTFLLSFAPDAELEFFVPLRPRRAELRAGVRRQRHLIPLLRRIPRILLRLHRPLALSPSHNWSPQNYR